MTVYSVFEHEGDPAPAVLADRFSWFAALLPPVYALVHGLWLGLALYALKLVAIGVLSLWIGGAAAFWIYLLLAILIGFEAPALRAGRLRRRGWHWRSDIVAAGPDLAMRDWLARKFSTSTPA